MSLKINVTAEAANDAISIAEFLAGPSSLNTSDKFLSATTQVYRLLADMPGLGSPAITARVFPACECGTSPSSRNT